MARTGKQQVVVAVAGGGSGSGKTSLICSLLGRFARAGAVKIAGRHERFGSLVTSAPEVIDAPGKDTARYRRAGAAGVVLVAGEGEERIGNLRRALRMLRGLSPVFVEGGDAVRSLDADLKVFVEADGRRDEKRDAAALRGSCHLVVRGGADGGEGVSRAVELLAGGGRGRQVVRGLLGAAAGGEVSCARARRLAARLGVDPAQVGRLCDETGIRIVGCVLGCFGDARGGGKEREREDRRGLVVRRKVWIERDGKVVAGEGRAKLMRALREEGSLSAAARRCGVSYRKAWTMIRSIEEATGAPVIETEIGGRSGGGSRLTRRGERLLAFYEKASRTPLLYGARGGEGETR